VPGGIPIFGRALCFLVIGAEFGVTFLVRGSRTGEPSEIRKGDRGRLIATDGGRSCL
jgi:hypothetical protein